MRTFLNSTVRASDRHSSMAEWNITASAVAQNTSNPIRKIVDRMTVAPNPDKEPVRLSIGAIP